MSQHNSTEHPYWRLVEDGRITEREFHTLNVNALAKMYEKKYGERL